MQPSAADVQHSHVHVDGVGFLVIEVKCTHGTLADCLLAKA
jgi:hypothetical protein